MHSSIRPNSHIALRLPSGILKILEITPNTSINIGKFGVFPANSLLGRPFYFTYEVLDNDDDKSKSELRIVSASELHAETLGEHPTPTESRDDVNEAGVEFDIVGEDGEVIMRSNRLTIDDPSRQTLSMEEIEELKKAGTGSGKEIIAKIMASHMAIDEKTSFSLAKYTLRKSRKYLKRFTVLPVDVGLLTEHFTEKEAYRIMELRQEHIGLIGSWSNAHCANSSRVLFGEDGASQIGGGRWLVVDDTGGLVVAALAERMDILYQNEDDDDDKESQEEDVAPQTDNAVETPQERGHEKLEGVVAAPEPANQPNGMAETEATASNDTPAASTTSDQPQRPRRPPHQHIPQSTSRTNSITILHANNQPNLSILKYFSFDASNPVPNHPLYHHLRTLSWLQLMSPHDDPTYQEPEKLEDDALAAMKSSKRGNYYKKRRRWERTNMIVDETRQGGFDGLVVCSVMGPASILKECVPLVRGGGRVVVYSPNVEPLIELCDLYSKERRAAYVSRQTDPAAKVNGKAQTGIKIEGQEAYDALPEDDEEDFPVNPTSLLAPSLQTSRARQWQVLPGRTHPMMTSKGGAEGYLFTATRVLPIEGKVEARGSFFRGKKRKTAPDAAVQA
ncbi:Gcd10p-domain-containing protein [Polyplosphaeria fusca]|uniref:tRNA (adenine(58)-N(1))-methyltransferase non-catalytic subunit TRM6 n=1 Tax=Polyplosphaeria fusca TaxID=682080 RepID=A0A9P4UVJ3_9PLEO|nr:Gcd10p-domain-containing protein [Polyplosphaeria fusca]